MASTTPNIGLTLPTGAEKVSRQIINANNTIIDGKMGAVPGGQNLQGEIDALNGNITTINSNLTPTEVTATKSNKLNSGSSSVWCRRMGKLVIIQYYIVTASACSRDDVLCTFDLPSNFSMNYFSSANVGGTTYNINLKNAAKTLTADGTIASGAAFGGQVVGFIL